MPRFGPWFRPWFGPRWGLPVTPWFGLLVTLSRDGRAKQVATVDEDLRELRRQRSAAFLARNARAIRRLQRAGLADPALDADLASLALSSMVSRSAYVTFALGQGPADAGRLAATLTRLWVSALRIPSGTDIVEE